MMILDNDIARELRDDELRTVNGGTSGLIYAVAQAAHKVLAQKELSGSAFGAALGGPPGPCDGQPH
jgi:hypothetical protein